MPDIFFYGLFMDRTLLEQSGLAPRDPRRAHLQDRALALGARARIEPAPARQVHGVVMTLTAAELERLYAQPGVDDYRPEPAVAILQSGETLDVEVYNLPGGATHEPVNREYARQLAALAERLELPVAYRTELEALRAPSEPDKG